MTRATCAVARKKRTKRLMKAVKGFWGDRKNHKRTALSALMKSRKDMFIGRKLRKRDFRSLWIVRIGTAAKMHGISYNRFIHGLDEAGVRLNRKILAWMAAEAPAAFAEVANVAKAALVAERASLARTDSVIL